MNLPVVGKPMTLEEVLILTVGTIFTKTTNAAP
jgi:hypothetical protein